MTSVEIFKKVFPVSLMVLFILIVSFFLVFPPHGKLECEANGAPGDIIVNYKYSVDYKWWVVRKLSVRKEISSRTDESLDDYKKILEEDYKTFNNVKSVNSNVEMIGASLVGTFNIDYDNLDNADYKNVGSVIKYKNIFVGKLKNIYKKNGATCHYK